MSINFLSSQPNTTKSISFTVFAVLLASQVNAGEWDRQLANRWLFKPVNGRGFESR